MFIWNTLNLKCGQLGVESMEFKRSFSKNIFLNDESATWDRFGSYSTAVEASKIREKIKMPRVSGLLGSLFVALTVGIMGIAAAPQTAQSANRTIKPTLADGVVRHYYIAAEEVIWDYAPKKREMMMTGRAFNEDQMVFVGNSDKTIGRKYKKALYIEYQGPAFRKRKHRPSDATRGFMGPTLHAEVGDTIVVHFKNKASRPYSMHPHGVFYNKASEGAMTLDGGSKADKAGNAIAPGKTYTYIWGVPERAGPGPNDPSSVAWIYHSHVNAVKDVYAGLVGGMVVTRQGMAKKDGTPFDVDKEFVTLYLVSDENKSWYLNDNIRRFTKLDEAPADDDEFGESNLMHGINGYVYGNLPTPVMYKDDRVRFYMVGMGT